MLRVSDDDYDLEVVGVKLKRVHDVVNVTKCVDPPEPSWIVEHSSTSGREQCFVIDCHYDDAFFHWIFESAIYLPAYLELRKQHPGLKLLVKRMLRHKQQFFDLFGITADNLTRPHEQAWETAYLPMFYFRNWRGIPKDFIPLSERLFDRIMAVEAPHQVSDYHGQSIVYFPRNTTGNYKGNNRVIMNQDQLIACVRELGGYVKRTEEIQSFRDQLDIIAHAKCVVLDYGSAFYVNGFVAENATIIVLNWMDQHEEQDAFQWLYERMLKQGNKITFLRPTTIYDHTPEFKFDLSVEELREAITASR